MFRRGDCLPMPMPERGDLQELIDFLNVDEDNLPLLLAWMVTAIFFPSGQCPIALLDGPAGSGKSSALKTVIATIDPKVGAQAGEPKSEDDLFAAAYGAGTVSGDNFSSIARISDPLCRLSTGGGIRKRKLYTDFDTVSLDVMRPVIIAGIDPTFHANDLAERIIRITLERPKVYLNDRQFEALLKETRARFTGAILDLVVACLSEAEDTDGKFRFPTYVSVGEVVAQRLGHEEGWFAKEVAAMQEDQAASIADGDCVYAWIVRLMAQETGQRMEARACELWEAMQEAIDVREVRYPRDDVPRNAKAMSTRISRIIPILERDHFVRVSKGARRSFIFEWDDAGKITVDEMMKLMEAHRAF